MTTVSAEPAESVWVFFFFNDTATTEIYALSLHDALPISDAFLDPITFRMGGVSGDILTVGALTTTDLAMTFTAGTGNTGTFVQSDGASTIATGTGAITVNADLIALSATVNTVTTTGAITLQPTTAGRPIVIGAAGGASDFALSTAEIAALTDNASGITIGKADSGAVTISAITFNDPITILGAAMSVTALNDRKSVV